MPVMTPTPPLLVTRDDDLLDDVLRLAAAAGVALDVAHDAGDALRSWSGTPVVLVGADQAESLGRHSPPRRDRVHVVVRGPAPDPVFRDAVALGAREVVELPAAEDWLVEVLSDAADATGGAAAGAVSVGVVAGSGGAGASTFAAALALVASRVGPATLLDLDPWGPGLDRIAGMDECEGIRWEGLTAGSGRLGSRALRAALPRREQLALLTWGASPGPAAATGPAEVPGPAAVPGAAGPGPELGPEVAVEVFAAARRGADHLVLDLPRHLDPASAGLVPRCDRVVLVVGDSVPAVAAAAKVTARLRRLHEGVCLVVRTAGAGLPVEAVASTLGLPLVADFPSRRRVPEQVELGLGPVAGRRGPLARAARETWEAVGVVGRAVA
jgi:secretion/DNA translocation related CpaE-like protein